MRPQFPRFLPISIVAIVAVLVAAATATATLPAGNVVTSGDFEAQAGSTSATAVNPPRGWISTTGKPTVIKYGTSGYPTTAQSTSSGGGANFVSGGDRARSVAQQTIDVSVAATEIDAGTTQLSVSALLGGYANQGDSVGIDVRMQRTSSSDTTLATASIAPVTPSDRSNTTQLLPRSTTATVPAGTRYLVVVMTFNRTSGTSNDGYADNVSIRLSQASSSQSCSVFRRGTASRDRLIGTRAGDRIFALAGADFVFGGYGDDCLFGNGGNDTLAGGPGNDRLVGGPGNDRMTGYVGRDRYEGGPGNDVIHDANGAGSTNTPSIVFGGSGNDYIRTTAGRDRINGGSGRDRIYAFAGNDLIIGGAGNDRISPGNGSDRVFAGSGDDYIYAPDRFNSREFINCGPGRDIVVVDRDVAPILTGCEVVRRSGNLP